MQLDGMGFVLLFAGLSFATALLALAASAWICTGRRGTARGPAGYDVIRRYEFREGYLLSDADANDVFLPEGLNRAAAWDDLSNSLSVLGPTMPDLMTALAARGESFLQVGHLGDDALAVSGEVEHDRLVITVTPTDDSSSRLPVQRSALMAMQREILDLRNAVDLTPIAMWRESADHRLVWANSPYYQLVEQLAEGDAPLGWPLPRVFADHFTPPPDDGTPRRCSLPGGIRDAPLCFEVTAHPQIDGTTLFSAHPIDRLVTAETALRNFVQTLSQTFAHLPVGLAIFDKTRKLVLFNPALLTLSTLEPEFLSGRPSLGVFLDQLRERQRMPEPKNYRAWRDEISRLEQGARDGTYQELWTLPTGQSYRVIGRPHHDGAVAFMFEDISSEVSLTRQFRSDLDLYQAVLDDSEDALAVFSNDERLVMSNDRYAALWGTDPRETLGEISLTEATRQWQADCVPDGVFGDIRSFSDRTRDRSVWAGEMKLLSGARIAAHVAPLRGGAMSVRFRPLPTDAPAVSPAPLLDVLTRHAD